MFIACTPAGALRSAGSAEHAVYDTGPGYPHRHPAVGLKQRREHDANSRPKKIACGSERVSAERPFDPTTPLRHSRTTKPPRPLDAITGAGVRPHRAGRWALPGRRGMGIAGPVVRSSRRSGPRAVGPCMHDASPESAPQGNILRWTGTGPADRSAGPVFIYRSADQPCVCSDSVPSCCWPASPPISMRRRRAFSLLGMVTVSTPSWKAAWMFSASTSRGSTKLRVKVP
jgi:hypothetical protein